MTKESLLSRTYEIKTNILESIKTPAQLLSYYLKDRNIQKFKEYFEKHKINVDTVDNEQNSLLNIAVQCNNSEVVSYLLDLGANVNLQNVK
jgi:ankyrin repeat protein